MKLNTTCDTNVDVKYVIGTVCKTGMRSEYQMTNNDCDRIFIETMLFEFNNC